MKSRFRLKVNAGAARTAFRGRYGDAWKLSVRSPPVDGKANEAIIRFLADLTGLRTSAIRIISGQTSSLKLIEADGLDLADLERAILESHGPCPHTGSPSPPAA